MKRDSPHLIILWTRLLLEHVYHKKCLEWHIIKSIYNQLQKHHSCCRRSGGGALHCKWESKEFVGGARLLGAQEWRWTGGVLRKLIASRKWSTRSAKDQSFFPIIVHDRFERWLCAYTRPGYGVHLNSDNLHLLHFFSILSALANTEIVRQGWEEMLAGGVSQCPERFLGIIGQNISVSKSNLLTG